MNYDIEDFKHGMKCICTIDGIPITDAKISVGPHLPDKNRISIFICQNSKAGYLASDKLGYQFSWWYKDLDCSANDWDVKNLVLIPEDRFVTTEDGTKYKVITEIDNLIVTE